jgi:hypothetical protein
LTRIESNACWSIGLESVVIPSNVEILGSKCFSACESLLSISFESHSRLTRIESEVFSRTSLQSIVISRNPEFSDSTDFINVRLSSISIKSGNEYFVVVKEFLIDVIDHRLIRNFSRASHVEIPSPIEILGSNCFLLCDLLSSISFEHPSQLKQIESHTLNNPNVMIVIPSTVLFIAFDAALNPFQILIVDCDSCPEFNRWQELVERGIEVDF